MPFRVLIRSRPALRTAMPLGLLLCTALTGAYALAASLREAEAETFADEEAELIQKLHLLQGSLQRLVDESDWSGADEQVAELGSDRDTTFAVLVGPHGNVRASLRREDVGHPLAQASARLPSQVRAAMERLAPTALVSGQVSAVQQPRAVLGAYPVTFAAGALHPTDTGELILVRRVERRYGSEVHARVLAILEYTVVLCVLAAVLWLYFHQTFSRRAQALVAAARRVAAGESAVRTGERGGDELGEVGKAFDQMAAEIELGRARLQDSAEQLDTLLDSAAEAILGLDPLGRCTLANQAAVQLLGRESKASLLGIEVHEALTTCGRELFARALRGEEAAQAEPAKLSRPDGSLLEVECWTRPLVRRGARAGTVLTFVDVSERRRMQAQLTVAERLAAVGTLAAGVAHEVNNPLAYIASNLAYARDELAAEPGAPRFGEVLTALDEAQEGASRVRDIVTELRRFSRIDESAPGPVNLAAVCSSSLKLAASELRHRAQLVTELDGAWAQANEGRLGQVLLNLLINAAQALPEGEPKANQVRVRCGVHGPGEVYAEVSDTGPGIPPELLGRIFDPFFTTKPLGTGTGLGLAISQSIVSSFGGRIEVRSRPGEGATFRVVVPAAEQHAQATDPGQDATGLPPGRKVLVVDDEPLVRKALVRLLGGQEVSEASDGADALRLLEERRFDVVLCDVMMPALSGAELYGRVRDRDPRQAERFVFISGGALNDRDGAFLEQVPNPVVAKPFDGAQLQAALRRVDARGAP